MIVQTVKIISYDKLINTCKASLLNGDVIELDPYVGCAIDLSDEEYAAGKGSEIVGKSYYLTEYTVYKDQVVPSKGGMTAV